MPALAPRHVRVSEAEFLSLPESLDKIELVDGEVIVSPAPSVRHQRLVGEVFFALRSWALANPPATVLMAPSDVRVAPERIVQPDVYVVLAGIPSDTRSPVEALPDLVVEVVSARRSYDRFTKRVLYAEAGVPEYWIVDPDEERVEVHRPDGALPAVTDVLTSSLLPGFTLDVRKLFAS